MQPKNYLFYISQNYSFSILRPLQNAIRARGDNVSWFLSGDEINESYLQQDESRLYSVKQVKAFSPCAVFTPGNVVPDFFPGIKVELFHGFNARKRGTDDHFVIRGFFDLYCTQGPDTTENFKKLAKQYGFFRVIETGWPKLDPIFTTHSDTKKNEKPIILYTSTFSKNLTSAPLLLEEIKTISSNGKYHWCITFHPKMDQSIVDAYKNIQHENLTFIETDNVIPLLVDADVMLCDTSSILQEFLILNKPVVTFNNKQPHECMINIKTPEELLPALNTALSKPEDLMEKIKHYSQHQHPYVDGKSSERVLDAVDWYIKEGYAGLKGKPINLIRKLKIRKKLGYYWF